MSALALAPGGAGLRLSWTPPAGDWEKYSVVLRNGSAALAGRTVGAAARQAAFSALDLGLVPGRSYGAEVTVHSGAMATTRRCDGRLGQFTSS